MLSDALKTLSSAPSAGEKKQALATVNARITTLESQLGIKARLMPIFNPTLAAARLAELGAQVASKGLVTAPTVAPAQAAVAAAATVPADVRPLADYLKLSHDDRRMFCQDGLKLTLADFNQLSLHARMAFSKNGGRLADDAANSRPRCTLAASFGGGQ